MLAGRFMLISMEIQSNSEHFLPSFFESIETRISTTFCMHIGCNYCMTLKFILYVPFPRAQHSVLWAARKEVLMNLSTVRHMDVNAASDLPKKIPTVWKLQSFSFQEELLQVSDRRWWV